jgi:hypothetical protein
MSHLKCSVPNRETEERNSSREKGKLVAKRAAVMMPVHDERSLYLHQSSYVPLINRNLVAN